MSSNFAIWILQIITIIFATAIILSAVAKIIFTQYYQAKTRYFIMSQVMFYKLKRENENANSSTD